MHPRHRIRQRQASAWSTKTIAKPPNTMSTVLLNPSLPASFSWGHAIPESPYSGIAFRVGTVPIHLTKPLRSPISIWFSDELQVACATPNHAKFSSCLSSCPTPNHAKYSSCEFHIKKQRCPHPVDALCNSRLPYVPHHHLQHSCTRRLQLRSISFSHPASARSFIPLPHPPSRARQRSWNSLSPATSSPVTPHCQSRFPTRSAVPLPWFQQSLSHRPQALLIRVQLQIIWARPHSHTPLAGSPPHMQPFVPSPPGPDRTLPPVAPWLTAIRQPTDSCIPSPIPN